MSAQRGIRAGRAFVEMHVDNAGLQRGLRRAQARLRAFGSMVQQLGANMMRIGAGITAPLTAAAARFASLGDELDTLSNQTDITVESLSELRFAIEQSGGSGKALGDLLQRMNRRLGRAADGSGEAAQAVAELGLSMQHVQQLRPEERFLAIVDAMHRMDDASRAAGLGQRIFGTQVDDLLPLIRQGTDGIERLRAQARAAGVVISGESAESAAAFAAQMKALGSVLRTAVFSVGEALAPLFQEFAQAIMDSGKATTAWIQANQDLIRTLFRGGAIVTALGVSLVGLGTVINLVSAGLGGLATASKVATAALAGLKVAASAAIAHPVIAGVLALAAAGATLAWVMTDTTNAAQDQLKAVRRLRAENARLMDHDRQRMQILRELAHRESLSSDEKERARDLIDQLQERYGNLGISIDSATGEIEGFSEAMAELNRRMREHELEGIKREIDALNESIEESEVLLDRFRRHAEGGSDLGHLVSGGQAGRIQKQLEESRRELERLEIERDKLLLRLTEPDSAASSPAEDPPDRIGEAEQRFARRAHQARIRLIEDEHRRRVAEINERYAHEIHQAREAGHDVTDLMRARLFELESVRRDLLKQRHDEESRAAEEQRRDEQLIFEANRRQWFRVLELRIRKQKDGIEMEEALLDLQKRQALEDAERRGLNLELVREEFELRRKMLGIQEAMDSMPDAARHVQGQFGGRRLEHVFGARRDDQVKRIADSVEEIQANTRPLSRGDMGTTFL